jgi:hypothetical protein
MEWIGALSNRLELKINRLSSSSFIIDSYLRYIWLRQSLVSMVVPNKLGAFYHTLILAAIYRKLSGNLVPLIGLELKYYGAVETTSLNLMATNLFGNLVMKLLDII